MKFKLSALAVALGMTLGGAASAANFSFTGNFAQDDEVQAFTFTVGALSSVTLRAWSYAGGVNAAGNTIARGGFDTILALFDSSGALIDQNDDGGCGNVGMDAVTGNCWDTFLTSAPLAAGLYTVTIMEYNNFANGPNLSNGFTQAGNGNFTSGFGCGGSSFCDVSTPSDQRDSHWAFDILNVESAAVPLPGTLALLGLGLTGLGVTRRKTK